MGFWGFIKAAIDIGGTIVKWVTGAEKLKGAAAFVATLINTVALTFVSKLVTPRLKFNQSTGVRSELAGRNLNSRGAVEPRNYIYGEIRYGGQLAHLDASSESGSNKNELLHLVVAHADHEVEDLGDIYINNELVPLTAYFGDGLPRVAETGSKYEPYLQVFDHHGEYNQAANSDSNLSNTAWSSAHRLRGVAYSYVQLNLDLENNVFQGGLPVLSRVVKGRKVMDPRVASTAITGATQANPVVITATAHPFSDGDEVYHSQIVGMTELNRGRYKIANKTANTYELDGVDGTSFGAYVSGGEADLLSWSDNWALCLGDYLMSEMAYGRLGMDKTRINSAAWQAAADDSDDVITLNTKPWVTGQYVTKDTLRTSDTGPVKLYKATVAGSTGATAPTGTGTAIDDGTVTWDYVEDFVSTESRYTLNGAVHATEDPSQVVRKMRTAGSGFCEFIGGYWYIAAGKWRDPVCSLGVGDFAGAISTSTKDDRRSAVNRVKGYFADKDDRYNTREFPAVVNATYLAEDGGFELWKDIELPYTVSSANAQRLAKINLERARQGITHQSRFQLEAMEIQAGDNFGLTFPKYGYGDTGNVTATSGTLTDTGKSWTVNAFVGMWVENVDDGSSGLITANDETTITATLSGGTLDTWTLDDEYKVSKIFTCVSHRPVSDTGGALVVDMSFRETASTVYDWAAGEETVLDPASNTALPDPFTVPAPVMAALTDEIVTVGDSVVTQLRVAWTAGQDAHVSNHEVQYKKRNAYTVTGITQANPAVVSVTPDHDFVAGQVVDAYSIGGMTELNGNSYTVANPTGSTFELLGVDSTSYGAWTSGGWFEQTWDAAITVPMPSELFWVSPVEDGQEYDVRVRAVTALAKSEWDMEQAYTVVGKSATPTTPANFSIVDALSTAIITVDAHPDADFKQFLVWEESSSTPVPDPLVDAPDYIFSDTNHAIGVLAQGSSFYFFIAAEDTSGNFSAVASFVILTPSKLHQEVLTGDNGRLVAQSEAGASWPPATTGERNEFDKDHLYLLNYTAAGADTDEAELTPTQLVITKTRAAANDIVATLTPASLQLGSITVNIIKLDTLGLEFSPSGISEFKIEDDATLGVKLNWGGDTNLYRAGANILKTDDAFEALSFTDRRNALNSEWGIVGDGTTDDTAAIQTFVDTMEYCYFPSGEYKITSEITIDTRCLIVGDGIPSFNNSYTRRGTRFIYTGTADCFVWSYTANMQGIGGIMECDIQKSTAATTGYAITLESTSGANGFIVANVNFSYVTSMTWGRFVHVARVSGTSFFGNIYISNVSNAESPSDEANAFYFEYAEVWMDSVHTKYTGVTADNAGITIQDTSFFGSNLWIAGKVTVDNATAASISYALLHLSGHVAQLDVDSDDVYGICTISSSDIANASKNLSIKSERCDSFHAVRTASDANVTGDGTALTVTYSSEKYDKNNSFVHSTGIFTAKIAGRYEFAGMLCLEDLASGHTRFDGAIVHKNSVGTLQEQTAQLSNPYAISVAGFATVILGQVSFDLDEGDTVEMTAEVTGGAKVVDIFGSSGGGSYSYFEGRYIG